jgi:glyceraldehyde-3-phosphate dehydrogenase (NADP+)
VVHKKSIPTDAAPYNYPLNETWTTLIPGLVMGNTVVAKLPRFGQLLHLPIYSAFADSFPPGVVNFSGDGRNISAPLMASGDVDVLAFIGSQGVGDMLKKCHPALHRLRCVLGLGAKNAGIVLADADLEVAVREAVPGALSFNGQRCTALKVLHVERSIADAFVRRYADAVATLKAVATCTPRCASLARSPESKPRRAAGSTSTSRHPPQAAMRFMESRFGLDGHDWSWADKK